MLHDGHWIGAAIVIAGAGAYSFWFGFRALSKTRAIENTATARIRSAAQGYAEFNGVGELPPRIVCKGPLTGLPCTWWTYKIEERGGGAGRNRGWHTIDKMTSETPFLLDDGTGKCLVDPRGAEVVAHEHTVWYGAESWPQFRIPPGDGPLGKFFDVLLSGGRYRYTERRLNAAQMMCALGEFRTSGGVSGDDPEDGVLQLLHEWKSDQAKLLRRFDANHDGQIDAAEWEQVRAAARAEVIAKRGAREREPTVAVLAQPADGRAFLLSDSDQASLARRFKLQAAAGTACFVLSMGALMWIWQNFG
jgi:E3 Ubiquitin ligase